MAPGPMNSPDSRGQQELQRELLAVDGLEVSAGEPLARHTTFRIGGPAELFVGAASEPALRRLQAVARDRQVPFRLLGLGSNVLLPDAGLTGIVARLIGDFLKVRYDGELVHAGAGLPLARLARQSLQRGLLGLEALAGFPSTVGGAVWMNAGSYGVEIKDVLESAELLLPDGTARELSTRELEPGYRRTNLPGSGAIVVRATFRLRSGDPAPALETLRDIDRRRRRSLPSGRPNIGSIFKNPEGDYAGRLIEECGLKGARSGGAQISERHANVIVNTGGALASDVLELMLQARGAVRERFGITLEPEVILVGEVQELWRRRCEPAVSESASP